MAITCGDPNGIGSEVALKAVSTLLSQGTTSTFILVGPPAVWRKTAEHLDISVDPGEWKRGAPFTSNVVVYSSDGSQGDPPQWGELSAAAGRTSMVAVDDAIELCLSGLADAMVTAPISKEAVNLAGYKIPGHTEHIRDATGSSDVLMVMVGANLKVAVATGHIPLADVPSRITPELLRAKIEILDDCLRSDFLISDPAIAVLGLNPHAGDGGVIGSEDATIIAEAVKSAQDADLNVVGPFPADGFFGARKYREYDGVLANYHDQGLIPFKTIAFNRGVNVTAGLPIVRTSPDHGTAFDIAGKGDATESSMLHAINVASSIAYARLRKTAPVAEGK
ncbi:MAG: 4-hydroxythreonine-4-phosphate dehydrogenase PdxA [Rhodothermales bacterium]|nr:4-hydroxythreonine-4-phosphate dehydrogenase PdxA [Rhodothermales bacterium]